jgi:hypothetical protein
MSAFNEPGDLHARAHILPTPNPEGKRPNGQHRSQNLPLPRGGKSRPPQIHSAAELQKRAFPPIKFIVPGIIGPGLTLFAGKPKIGKSWFCLDIGLCVSAARCCLGDVLCNQGGVLYLALEDNHRRLQKRIKKLLPNVEAWPSDFHYVTECPRADEGGLDWIRNWCETSHNSKLVVLDVLAAFRSQKNNQQTNYESDYLCIKGLQNISLETGVAIVVVHHTRKASADVDLLDTVSGTLGLNGAADTARVLDRDSIGCRLHGRGRDVEEIDKAVSFNAETCRWSISGEADEIRRSDERTAITDALLDADEPLSPSDLADILGAPRNNTKQLLHKMAKAGEVQKLPGRGKYIHPTRDDLISPRNFDNRITLRKFE